MIMMLFNNFNIKIVSKYSSSPVYITNIKYDYNGAFRGTYEGRVAE